MFATHRRLSVAGLLVVPIFLLGTLQAQDRKEANKASHSAVKAVDKKTDGWVKRHRGFLDRARKGDVEVLFLGDSITQGWEDNGKDVWKKQYEPLKAANFGIGGDQTQHVLWRITEGKELEGIAPRAAVLMIGTNNLNDNSAEQIADGISAIVAALRHQKPHMKILLLAVFPRSARASDGVRAKIKDVNQRVAKLDDGKSVKYLDIGDKFLESDGSLSKDIMYDHLHLTAKGYQIWADAITPALQDMLKK